MCVYDNILNTNPSTFYNSLNIQRIIEYNTNCNFSLFVLNTCNFFNINISEYIDEIVFDVFSSENCIIIILFLKSILKAFSFVLN